MNSTFRAKVETFFDQLDLTQPPVPDLTQDLKHPVYHYKIFPEEGKILRLKIVFHGIRAGLLRLGSWFKKCLK